MLDSALNTTMDADAKGEKVQHRKPHQKSRTGCTQCKARRVKCDEGIPACSNCKRRREECSYNGNRSANTPEAGDSPAALVQLQERHISQLELMHQYCTSTYATFVTLPRDQHLAQVEIPRMALSYDFLLDALFALTSLHLAANSPIESARLVEDAVRYQTNALATCRQGLDNLVPNGTKCRAMFHCSALLGIGAMALHCVRSKTNTAPRPSETLLESAKLWRGTGLMLHHAQKLLDPETFKSFFPLPDWFTMVVSGSSTTPAHQILERLRARVRTLHLAPGSPGNHTLEDRQESYSVVIDKLQKLFHVRSPEAPAVLNILIEISPLFLEDLVDGQPMAATIGLMYTVLLRELRDHWWAKDYQDQLMNELFHHVPESDRELFDIAIWVRNSS